MPDIKQLGENIKFYRQRSGYTQAELGEKLSVTFQAVSSWENSVTLPDVDNLCRLARVLGVSTDELLQVSNNYGKTVILGVDGGGTKSEFVLCTTEGNIIKTFKLEGTNVSLAGIDNAFNTYCHGIDLCIADQDKISGVFIGTAGSGLEDVEKRLKAKYPALNVFIDSDGINALSCVNEADAAVICGTGSIIFIRETESFRKVGGWGSMLGDPGSAFNFGKQVIKAAIAYEDKISNDSYFYDALCKKCDINKIRGAFSRKEVSYIASLSHIVFDAYKKENETAQKIMEIEMKELAELMKKSLTGGRISTCGGIFEHYSEYLLPILSEYVSKDFNFVLPSLPPVYGACVECAKRIDERLEVNFEHTFAQDYQRLTK